MAIASAIGAVAGIGAALIGSSAQNKASKRAAATAQQTADSNNALALNIYGQNRDMLNTYNNRGNVAGDAINALLGLPSAAPQPAQIGLPNLGTGGGQTIGYGGGVPASPVAQYNGLDGGMGAINPNIANALAQYGFGAQTQAQAQPQAQPGMTPATANNAFQNYLGSTGYQFRVNEGNKSLNAGFAARGIANSGAAAKSAMQYGQNIASDEFARYLGYLSNQQGVGLSGASAVAGVGQNYVNNVTANNNSAGSAAANAALIRGQNTANMWGTVGNSLGQFVGSSFKG